MRSGLFDALQFAFVVAVLFLFTFVHKITNTVMKYDFVLFLLVKVTTNTYKSFFILGADSITFLTISIFPG